MSWCIIVPYRNREEHLNKFVPHYNKLFPDVDIIIVEQCNDNPFNLGKLVNIGFMEKGINYDYFAKHDVDMLGRKISVDYSFPNNPTHIATMCQQFRYRMPYKDYFGGVNLFTKEQFYNVNGFPNNLNGWGAEDDILRESFIEKGYTIDRRMCIFDSLEHDRKINQNDYKSNVEIMKNGRDFSNGISSCNYDIISIEKKEGYTLIKTNFKNK
jgi:beta-1,4-galactosyltransferase 3